MKDKKLVDKCLMCNCNLPKNHNHHFYCYKCWFKHKEQISLRSWDITKKLKPLKIK